MVQLSMAERQACLGVRSWPVGGSVHAGKTPVLEDGQHTGLRDGGWCEGTLGLGVSGRTYTLLRREFHSWMCTLEGPGRCAELEPVHTLAL